MRTLSLSFVLNTLSAIAAAGASGFWWASAAVPLPVEGDLTAGSAGWRHIADALLDQGVWNRYGAACAALAIGFQAVTIITQRIP